MTAKRKPSDSLRTMRAAVVRCGCGEHVIEKGMRHVTTFGCRCWIEDDRETFDIAAEIEKLPFTLDGGLRWKCSPTARRDAETPPFVYVWQLLQRLAAAQKGTGR